MARNKRKKKNNKGAGCKKASKTTADPDPSPAAIPAIQAIENPQQTDAVDGARKQNDNGKCANAAQRVRNALNPWRTTLDLIFTACIATAAFIALGVSSCQWIATNNQYIETQRSNDIAEATAKRQLRAYVNILTDERPRVQFYGGIEGQPLGQMVLELKVRNSGQTPAYHVIDEYDAKYLQAGVTEGTHPPKAVNRNAEGGATMGPGREWTLTIPYSLRPSDAKPSSGRDTFWAVGRIEYRDAFGDSHYTNFRYRQLDMPGPDKWDMEITGTGNDSD